MKCANCGVDILPTGRRTRCGVQDGCVPDADRSRPPLPRPGDGVSNLRLPEWFIGGPLHGEDKLTRFPRVTTHEIRYPHFENFDAADPFNERATVTEYSYGRTKFAIGRTELTIWVLYGMDRLDAGDRLAEILLAPHLTEAS